MYKLKPTDVKEHIDWISYKRGQVDALSVEFRNWLAKEIPDQSTLLECEDALDDDSKLWIDRTGKEDTLA